MLDLLSLAIHLSTLCDAFDCAVPSVPALPFDKRFPSSTRGRNREAEGSKGRAGSVASEISHGLENNKEGSHVYE